MKAVAAVCVALALLAAPVPTGAIQRITKPGQVDKGSIVKDAPDMIAAGTKQITDMEGCSIWTHYNWPSFSFWALEVWRRQQSVDPQNSAQVDEMWRYSRRAAFFTCSPGFDPRKGTTWSEPVQDYLRKAKREETLHLPSPPFDPFMTTISNISYAPLMASQGCMDWVHQLFCDAGWWATQLQGSKDYRGGLCWDRVQHPGYAFTGEGWLSQHVMPRRAPPGTDQTVHPEYLECLEHPVNKTVTDAICPYGGYEKDGLYGVAHYGDGVPQGLPRQQVDQCRARVKTSALSSIEEQEITGGTLVSPSSPEVGFW